MRFLFCLLWMGVTVVHATSLLSIYQDAFIHDATFRQAISQQLADQENVSIQLSGLLPAINATVAPSILKSANSGLASNGIGSYSKRGYQANIVMTQSLYDVARYQQWQMAKALAKQSMANLNYVKQDLMVRVVNHYLHILQDQDNLNFLKENEKFYALQLKNILQEYRLGAKTITDVEIAKAAYAISITNVIAAKNKLSNDQENLRVMTGKAYGFLTKLNDKNLLKNQSGLSSNNNWQIQADQYAVSSALHGIKRQFARHLPTLNIQTSYTVTYLRNTGGTGPFGSVLQPTGYSQTHNRVLQLNLSFPLFSGSEVAASTRQAQYQYQTALQKLRETVRTTNELINQYYFSMLAIRKQVDADKKTIQAMQSALYGTQMQYHFGKTNLLTVFYYYDNLLKAKKQYSADVYGYIRNWILLKQSAGILGLDDLALLDREHCI